MFRTPSALILLRSLLTLLLLLGTLWGALALWFQLAPVAALPCALLWSSLGLTTIWTVWPASRGRPARLIWCAAAVAALLMTLWWQSLQASHTRPWADDVARMLVTERSGEQLTLHNVRSVDWRTETDYVAHWETRHYDLAQLATADLILSYWMGPHIAHTLVSFGFDDGRQLVFSLEIRKERSETFSALGGFFRRFEQVIIAADERDLIRTRSNVRHEQVYLYRLRADRAQLRAVLLNYLARAEDLRATPAFYNTLTSNCTTILFELARQIAPTLPLDYRLLASGHFAQYAYDQGALKSDLAYPLLMQRGHINARAQRADRAAEAAFSRAIRAGVPGIATPAADADADRRPPIKPRTAAPAS